MSVRSWTVGVLAVLLTGCQVCPCTRQSPAASGRIEVTGQVTGPAVGSPPGRLAFVPTGEGAARSAFGVTPIQADGSFRIELSPGPYRVEFFESAATQPSAVFQITVTASQRRWEFRTERAGPSPGQE